jgi:hypothetical protein
MGLLLGPRLGSRALIIATLWAVLASPAYSAGKDSATYGEGLIVNIPLPVAEVTKAVEEVAGNGIIRGTKEYNKDEYVSGAELAKSTPVFPAWTDPGQVFYKVRQHALDPRNFKDSGDVGTLAVRYVVQPQGEKNTVLRIDALFVEDFRHSVHPSNGSVESSEYKDIQDHLAEMEKVKRETEDAEELKREHAARQNGGLEENTELLGTPAPGSAESASPADGSQALHAADVSPTDPNETPEQHLAKLRQQVERLVRKPGAPLKSAPFHNASTLRSLEPGTEVLIVIVTPYWFGVETHDGEHGWIQRSQLELLP